MHLDLRHAAGSCLLLLAAGCASVEETPRFSAVSDSEAWARLTPDAPRLPRWARVLAPSLPATTALQLSLDHLHRVRNPLGPVLAAQLRWVAADANSCAYAKESAEADLLAAGVPADDIADLATSLGGEHPDAPAFAFARALTTAGSSIPDGDVRALVARYGEEDVVAMVHTVAHANFQQRIFLALGLAAEPGGAAPAVEAPAPADAGIVQRERRSPGASESPAVGASDASPWTSLEFEELRGALERQKEKTARIAEPDATRIARLPRPNRSRPRKVAWGRLTMPYQPELTSSWFRTMAAFDREAGLDQVFESSVFWVVTRTNDCFY